MPNLAHVVFYVRDLTRSTHFYREIVGLQVVGEIFNGRAVMLTGGSTHHELLLIEVGEAPGPLPGKRIGLYHVGWKIGDSLQALRDAKHRVEQARYTIQGLSDHGVSQSLYLSDPDGNEVELFVDNPNVDWKTSCEWINDPVKALAL